jgi:hypothetical protein
MAALAISIELDEFLGLGALALMDKAVNGGPNDIVTTAEALMRSALAARLNELGLPWAPSPETARKRAAKAAEPDGSLLVLMKDDRLRKYVPSVLAFTAMVMLWGGYIQGWKWTGFQDNDDLWHWLDLLLLPVVVGTVPLWIQRPGHVGRAGRLTCALVISAFTGLIVAGYEIPLKWTGFPSHKLWGWFHLLLVPVAVAGAQFLPSVVRSLRPYQKGLVVLIALGWIITIIGGYALGWRWTGYHGKALWDWLDLLLFPLAVPIIVIPAALQLVSGKQSTRVARAVAKAR